MSDSVRKAAPVSASEWDYCTIKELSAALESRQISASELLERTVARIEALDSRLNAVVVRDFERAREAARAADIALAKGERRALLGIPLGQGSVQCCRLADDLGLPGVQGFCTERGCTHHLPYETCGGRPAWQDQRAVGPRRFLELQRHLRNDQQSVGYQSLPGGLFRRLRCCFGSRLWVTVVRIGYRRVAARAGDACRPCAEHLRQASATSLYTEGATAPGGSRKSAKRTASINS
jgi:hypothetical protein